MTAPTPRQVAHYLATYPTEAIYYGYRRILPVGDHLALQRQGGPLQPWETVATTKSMSRARIWLADATLPSVGVKQ